MELILETLFNPSILFLKIKENRKILLSLSVGASAWLSFLVGGLVIAHLSISLPKVIIIFLLSFIFIVFMISIHTMWIHFISELFGGEGKAIVLFSLFINCLTPLHLFLPLSLILKNRSIFIILPILSIPIIWSKILGFKAIKMNYNLSYGKILTILILPAIFLSMFFLLILFSSIRFFHG